MKGLFSDVFPSFKSRVSKFTAMRLFTMRKKLWHHYAFVHSDESFGFEYAFGNLKLSFEALMKPLCPLYASYFLKTFGYSIHHIDALVKFQHIGIYNFAKQKRALQNGDIYFRSNDFMFYLSNIFSGGHVGLCKKLVSVVRYDFLALSRTMCAGHVDLFRLYLSNIPVQQDDLIQLFDYLLWYLDPTNATYYEIAEILLKHDSTIAKRFIIRNPKILKLIL